MAQTCDGCGDPVFRTRLIGGKFLGIGCRCAREIRAALSVTNPFGDLTLDHVHDERGKPVRVTSLRQLGEAEKRHNFSSVVLASDARNVDTPLQQRAPSMSDLYGQRKFSRGSR